MEALVPQQYPYLECPAEDDKGARCGRTMPLPRSSQLGKSPNLPEWPISAIREIFVNPECGHVCDYTELNVRWYRDPHGDPDRLERPFSALVEWNCDADSRKTLVVIQRPTRGAITEKELLTEAREKWIFVSAHCTEGHALAAVPDDAWAERWADDADA